MDRATQGLGATTDFQPLNPADHVLYVMDQEIRKDGLPGSYCGFALELQGMPDEARLREALDALLHSFPVATARLQQRGKRMGWVPSGLAIPLSHHPVPNACDEVSFQRQCLSTLMNTDEDITDPAPLSFHVIAGTVRCLVLLRWIHPLLDARGAKLIFDFLTSSKRDRYRGNEHSLVEQRLASLRWWQKLRLIYQGKRHNDLIDHLDSALPAAPSSQPRRLDFNQQVFDPDETQAILAHATTETGLTGRSLYFIGCLMRAMESTGMAEPKAGFCVPYAFNLRPQNAPTPVFGNHVSILFAQAPRALLSDRSALFNHLRAQYADTLRNGLDQAYLPLMWLGRWLSPARYGRLLRCQKGGGERSSVWFSDIGEVKFSNSEFLDAPITGMRHLCFTTAPPSLAVLFGQLNGSLSVSYNFLSPDISADWLTRLRINLRRELLADPAPQ